MEKGDEEAKKEETVKHMETDKEEKEANSRV